MKILLFLSLVLAQCTSKNPAGPVIASNEVNYGDTLMVGVLYQKVPDTTAGAVNALRITLVMRNTAGRPLLVDSTARGTYINVTSDSTHFLEWSSPAVVALTDTLLGRIGLNTGDSCFYSSNWPLDSWNKPVLKGHYTINGSILGKRTGNVVYEVW